VLRRILETRDFPFVGVIGSRSKRAVLERELRATGLSAERTTAFECPLGLPVGSNLPHEIAISIAAGLLAARDRHSTA
jgi:xanthine dehydrogenase accessory factor